MQYGLVGAELVVISSVTIKCHNDELSLDDELSWLFINRLSATR